MKLAVERRRRRVTIRVQNGPESYPRRPPGRKSPSPQNLATRHYWKTFSCCYDFDSMSTSQPIETDNLTSNRLEALIDEYEYSRITGRSVASARRDRCLGIGCQYVKLGALVRYRTEDVRAYIARNVRGVLQT